MLKKSKLLAGFVAAGATIFSTGILAADGKGAISGDIRWSLSAADDSGTGVASTGPSYSADNNNSYYGIKGSVSERGLTAFGGYERTLDNDTVGAGNGVDLVRQGYIGLKGNFGSMQYGKFGTAYFESGRKLDPFANTAVAGVGATAATGGLFGTTASHGLSAALTSETGGSGFIANQVAYTTPNFGGLTVNAVLFLDETAEAAPVTEQDQDHDYGLGVEFNNSGLTIGIQALDINAGGAGASFAASGVPANTEVQRIYGGLNTSNMGVNASVELTSLPGPTPGGDDAQFYFVSGWFGVNSNTRLAAAIGSENESGAEGSSLSLGVFHDVMENFTSWVAVRRFDGKGIGASGITADVLTLGASYKFDLGFGK